MRKGIVRIEDFDNSSNFKEFILEKFELKEFVIPDCQKCISVILYSLNEHYQFDLIPDTRCTLERMRELMTVHLHNVVQQMENCCIEDRSERMYIYFTFDDNTSEQFTGTMKVSSE